MAVEILPPSEPGLVALTRVRRVLGHEPNKANKHDALFEEWIAAVTAQFEKECAQPIRRAQRVLTFDGNGRDRHTLGYRPCSNLTLLEREYGFDDWETIDTTSYRLRTDDVSYWIVYQYGFARGMTYRATLEVGYDTIPMDIATIALNAVVLDWLDSPLSEGRLGTVQKSLATSDGGDLGATFSYKRDEFIARWKRTVAAYARIPEPC